MRINELFQVLAGVTATLLLATFPEPVRCDHVHLRIHVPEIVQKHKHVKTKFVHVYHPKVIATDIHHSPSLSFYSRKDPNNYDIVSGGGHSNPLFKQKNKNELKFTANDFYRWRKDQAKKSIADHHHKRNVAKQPVYEPEVDDDDVNNGHVDLNQDLDDEEGSDESERYSQSSNNHDNFYNKGNSSPTTKHKNHKYQDHYATSAEKSLHNYSNRHQWSTKQRKPTSHQHSDRTRKTKSSSKSRHKYQQPQLYQSLESQQQPQYLQKQQETSSADQQEPTSPQYLKSEVSSNVSVNDPTFYSTLPKNPPLNAADHDDDIYSGLLSSKPSKIIAEKSKLLADINYNRKQQTKIFTAQNKIQKQQSELLKS